MRIASKKASTWRGTTTELRGDADVAALALSSPRLVPHIQTRRDGSRFLQECGGCGAAGHLWSTCPRRHKICVVGDSHTSVWSVLQERYRRAYVLRTRVGGMSAYGLANASSRSQAANRIRRALTHIPGVRWLVVVAGQVDVDFLFHYRCLRAADEGGEDSAPAANAGADGAVCQLVQQQRRQQRWWHGGTFSSMNRCRCAAAFFSVALLLGLQRRAWRRRRLWALTASVACSFAASLAAAVRQSRSSSSSNKHRHSGGGGDNASRPPVLSFASQTRASVGNLIGFLDALCRETSFARDRVVLHGVHLPPLNDAAMAAQMRFHLNRGKSPKRAPIPPRRKKRKHRQQAGGAEPAGAVAGRETEDGAQTCGESTNARRVAVDVAHHAAPGDLGASEVVVLPHAERTQRALDFNAALGAAARSAGFIFVDIAPRLLDAATGVVDTRFVKRVVLPSGAHTAQLDEQDIHLCDEQVAPLYEAAYTAAGVDFDAEE